MNENRNCLILLLPGFPKDETDSSCLPSQQSFVRHLEKLCPQTDIIVLSFQYPYHTRPYNWFGIKVIPFAGKNKGGLKRLWLRQKINNCLEKILRQQPVIGLLSFWYGECAAVGNRFARRHGIKHFCWIRGQDAKKENSYPEKLKLPPASLIALSDFLQESFEKNHAARPFTVIPPGIDSKSFPGHPQKRDIDLLAAGSLIPLKQFHLFIEAVAALQQHIPGIKAVLIGDGPEQAMLKKMITEKKLEQTIVLTGELSHSETLELMQKSKLFLHPSSYEGFSGVCLEALAAGCHVISFCRAMNETIDHWYIVAGKAEMITKSLHLLHQKQDQFLSYIPYTIENSVKRISELFEMQPVHNSFDHLSPGCNTERSPVPGLAET